MSAPELTADGGSELVRLIVEMDEEGCLAEVRRLLDEGADPMRVLGWCNEGMRLVGSRYERGDYFMAALIMAGEIMAQATELISPRLKRLPGAAAPVGRVLVATVRGDIHNLGKDIFSLLLRCNNFEVTDLGVDVAEEEITAAIKEGSFDLVGLSVTLTGGIEALKNAVDKITGLPEPRPKVIIGGAVVDRHVQQYVKADLWAEDAQAGVALCLKSLSR